MTIRDWRFEKFRYASEKMTTDRYSHAYFTSACSSLLVYMHSRRLLHWHAHTYSITMVKVPCTVGSDPGCLLRWDRCVIHLSCDYLPSTRIYYAVQNLASPTNPAKTRAPSLSTSLSTAPSTFADFYDCDCQSLEGADSLAKDTILSKVDSAQGEYIYQVQYIQYL